ncbi:hypothetical protein J6590_082988 [Homalodisca vitripennis]|nr:hypothetical protein J6590_082988 [Homalodisca vitripennis]
MKRISGYNYPQCSIVELAIQQVRQGDSYYIALAVQLKRISGYNYPKSGIVELGSQARRLVLHRSSGPPEADIRLQLLKK